MSYTPTVWKSGDVVSSLKLNKLENGLAAAASGVDTLGNDLDEVKSEINEQLYASSSINLAGTSTPSSNLGSNKRWAYALPASKGDTLESIRFTSGSSGTLQLFSAKLNGSTLTIVDSIGSFDVISGDNTLTTNYAVPENGLLIVYVVSVSTILKYATSGGEYTLYGFSYSGGNYTLTDTLNHWAINVTCNIKSSVIDKIENQINHSDATVLTVSKNGEGRFDTINQAMQYADTYMSASKPVTIIVYPGIYNEAVKVNGRRYLSIVGVNRNTCVIKDTTGIYQEAPVRISGNGYVANLSIIANNENGTTLVQDGVVVQNPSYGVHIDDRHEDDDREYKITFENCYIFSAQNPAVGIGLDKNQTVEFINCELVREDTDDIKNSTSVASDVYAFKRNGGALFYHALYSGNYTNDNGYQKLVVKDCIMRNNEENVAFGEAGGMETQVTLEFINNVGYSDVNGATYVKGLSGATLSPLSFGNNCPAMNHTLP